MKIEIWSDIMCPFCYIGKRNFESAKPKDSVKIQKIAVLKQKTKNRFKRLGFTTLFTFLTLGIIDILDGNNSSSGGAWGISSDMSGAFFIAMMIFGLIWYLLFFIAVITWIVYQIGKIFL
jgi:hypothetical protein